MCEGRWTEKSGKDVTITAHPGAVAPYLTILRLRIRTRDRSDSHESVDAAQLAAGYTFPLYPKTTYTMELIAEAVGAQLEVTIVIGDTQVFQQTCTRGELPHIGRFKVTAI